jgi:hypothetical protein
MELALSFGGGVGIRGKPSQGDGLIRQFVQLSSPRNFFQRFDYLP